MISVFKELDREKTIISIPTKLAKKVEEKIRNSDIKSASEYVTFLLRLILSEESEVYSDIDDKKVRERLKRLGYL
ncbi:CopG family transcriptional regulator [Candidatus Woesearchaeota archaeon]|nr:MAG: CopG family transcriptional regulator [Candidatus Woesearchaeota archaeon]